MFQIKALKALKPGAFNTNFNEFRPASQYRERGVRVDVHVGGGGEPPLDVAAQAEFESRS
jgi:hypothetical protein